MEIIQKLYKGKVEVKFLGPAPETPSRHMYYVNGVRKTGVTTYLGIVDKSPQLMGWAVDLSVDYIRRKLAEEPELVDNLEDCLYQASIQHTLHVKEAGNIGDQVHGWIERYVKGETLEMPPSREALMAINGFLDWEKANNIKFISSERVIYSKKHDFIGKMDIEAKVNGKLCLIDIKTSNGIYNTYNLQTAAYLRADEEESGRKYKGRWIIRLAKENEREYEVRMEAKNLTRTRKGKTAVEYPPYQAFEAKFLDEDIKNIDRDYKAFLNAKALFEWNKETNPFKPYADN